MNSDYTNQVPLVDPADPKTIASQAIEYHLGLIWHLTNSIQPGGTPPKVIGPSMDASFFPDVVQMLKNAEIVMWRRDLQQHAEARADEFAAMVVEEDLLQPVRPELWVPYSLLGPTPVIYELGLARMSRLLVPVSRQSMTPVVPGSGHFNDLLLSVEFFSPTLGNAIDLDRPPSLLFQAPLVLGQPPRDNDHAAILSCVTFRRSTFIEEPYIRLDRAAQRRLKRRYATPSPVRIVQLRKKERSQTEQSHLSDREYQCSFRVKAHVRRPNPRMKVQRPIWVAEYIKGPADKPLKPPTTTVNVVRR